MVFGDDRRRFGRGPRRALTQSILIATITPLSISGHVKLVRETTIIFVLIVQPTTFIIVRIKMVKRKSLCANPTGMMWCVIKDALTMERSGRGVVRCYNSTLNVIQALAIAGGMGR